MKFNDDELNSFHDAVMYATDISHSRECLKNIFYSLPTELQEDGKVWGLNDSAFRDSVIDFLENNGREALIVKQ